MSRTYELWDGATRNLVAAYDCESDALAFVQQYVAEHGSTYASSWALLWDKGTTCLHSRLAQRTGRLDSPNGVSDKPVHLR
jgi:hypothetical protein